MMSPDGSSRGLAGFFRHGERIYRRIHSAGPGRQTQTLNFEIPPHIIAEAMQARNNGSSRLEVTWSAPISEEELRFVEEYVRASYPQFLIETVDQIVPTEESEEEAEQERGGHRHRFFSHITNRVHEAVGRYLPNAWTEEPAKIEFNPTSRLRELLAKISDSWDASISVQEAHMRYLVLQQCGVDKKEYRIFFAQSPQDAMILLGEAYPFKQKHYLSVFDKNSDEIAKFATNSGAKVYHAPLSWLDLRVEGSQLSNYFRKKGKDNPKGLFAYPLKMSENAHHSLHWVSEARRNLWHVLLDASQDVLDVDRNKLVLKEHMPDYIICVSPRIAQYPSRVTCLLIRNS